MTTLEQIEALKNEIGGVEERFRVTYAHGMALRQIIAEKDAEILNILATGGWANPLNVMEDGSFVNALGTSAPMVSHPILKSLLAVCESSKEFITGYQIIQPKIDKIAELEAQAQAEAGAYSEKLRAVTDAEEIAMAKAMLAAGKDPSLAKARQLAEEARPPHIEPPADPPLFRGKVPLVSA